MNRVLVFYGTTDGQTRKIARALADTLRVDGLVVDVVDAASAPPDLRPDAYDGVIVAASVHIGDYQRAVRRWVRANARVLNLATTAFVSVCLGVLERSAETHRHLEQIMERFLRRSGWRPSLRKIVAGAVLYTRYGWLKKRMMKRIVAKAGGGTDTTRDYEYTDWDDLRVFAKDFTHRLAVGQATGCSRW